MPLPDPMALAVDAAWAFQGLTFPNPAVGAAVVDEHGAVLAVDAHRKAGEPHAEVLALQQAFVRLGGDRSILSLHDAFDIHDYLKKHHARRFENCTVYVTLEPCAHTGKTPSCAGLLEAVGVRKVVIGERDPNAEAAGGAARLENAGIEVADASTEGTRNLLRPFRIWQTRAFVTFKWAQRLDGTVDGGIVSGEASRRFVHAMRDAADLLVIGGNTVRTDRPTLDARMVGGRAPDILIVSRRDDFDRTIPLFGVEGRRVTVSGDLSSIEGYRNVMVEGGPGLFASLKERCDMFLCFVAPHSGGTIRFLNEEENFEIVHLRRSGRDVMQWMVNG